MKARTHFSFSLNQNTAEQYCSFFVKCFQETIYIASFRSIQLFSSLERWDLLIRIITNEHLINLCGQVSAAKVLQETCNYIRSLNREVDDLSERLSELLATTDSAQAAIIRSLLTQ